MKQEENDDQRVIPQNQQYNLNNIEENRLKTEIDENQYNENDDLNQNEMDEISKNENYMKILKVYSTKILKALINTNCDSREKALTYVLKHLDDDIESDFELMANKVKAIFFIIKLSLEDKVYKIFNKGLELLESLSISNLIECELAFQL